MSNKPMRLFADEDAEDNVLAAPSSSNNTASATGFKINRQWADKYDEVKRKQELQQLAAKYGKDFTAGGADGAGGGEDEEEDEEEEDVGAEDDDANLITDQHEQEFASLLLKLKRDDPALKDPEQQFFSELSEQQQQQKPAIKQS